MANDPKTRRTLYIDAPVWTAIKIRALEEQRTISEVITDLLREFNYNPVTTIPLDRFQKKAEEEVLQKERDNRTVYILDEIWIITRAIAKKRFPLPCW